MNSAAGEEDSYAWESNAGPGDDFNGERVRRWWRTAVAHGDGARQRRGGGARALESARVSGRHWKMEASEVVAHGRWSQREGARRTEEVGSTVLSAATAWRD